METWDIRSLAIEPHQPQVLRSDEETRAIAIHLPAGEELQEHQVHERTYLLVADGEIEISQDGRTTAGGPGFLSHFRAQRAPHGQGSRGFAPRAGAGALARRRSPITVGVSGGAPPHT
jgi:redox-sensitive bicupin YhaK (pirin superfamily)